MTDVVVAFLDVGQGDCTIAVDRPTGLGLLIDCPPGRDQQAVSALQAHGATRLQLVIASHQHLDHLGGIYSVAKAFPIEQLRVNMATHVPADPADAKKLRSALRAILGLQRQGVQLMDARAGDSGRVGELKWDILAPDLAQLIHAQSISEVNHASVVTKLTVDEFRILVSADADADSWEAIRLRGADLGADILQIPHHGASMSTSSNGFTLVDLLEGVGANLHVISVASNNRYGHPSLQTLQSIRTLQGFPGLMCTQLNGICANCSVDGNTRCAGEVTVLITASGAQIIPSVPAHRAAVSTLPSAQCL